MTQSSSAVPSVSTAPSQSVTSDTTPSLSQAQTPANDTGPAQTAEAQSRQAVPVPDQARTGTSYAWANRHDLPGAPSQLGAVGPARTGFDRGEGQTGGESSAAQSFDAAREARRQSFMVERSRPVPVLRPGPQLSLGADRAAFNDRWAREAEEARGHAAKHNNDRDARLAAFMAERTAQTQSPTRSFNRSNRRER